MSPVPGAAPVTGYLGSLSGRPPRPDPSEWRLRIDGRLLRSQEQECLYMESYATRSADGVAGTSSQCGPLCAVAERNSLQGKKWSRVYGREGKKQEWWDDDDDDDDDDDEAGGGATMPLSMWSGHDKEFSRSEPFQAHRSRYKLPALQILMLQEYPADCPQAKRDLKSAHSESNVQYNVAVDLWHDRISSKTSRKSLARCNISKTNGHR
ncbi:unnamed protein product [Pleuronectes platessa]|uniref:Uncharacterized protein n=1 Tax=Pleuronectes platessa TaxID=8262 RepID=A0A9N7Z7E7_PLEPL|nr:unnamed protein product [Pleuronectes platessa]